LRIDVQSELGLDLGSHTSTGIGVGDETDLRLDFERQAREELRKLVGQRRTLEELADLARHHPSNVLSAFIELGNQKLDCFLRKLHIGEDLSKALRAISKLLDSNVHQPLDEVGHDPL